MTLAQEKNISKLSLRELNLSAVRLWEQIEQAQLASDSDDTESDIGLLIQEFMENQDATESKIDSIVWVKEMLESELVAWKERKERALLLYSDAIQSRESAINKIKERLLFLHKMGVIPERNVGKECEIQFLDNPPKIAELVMDIECEEFPPQFKKVAYSPNNQAIIEAHKKGIDVSEYATITVGKQIRFKRKKSNKSRRTSQ